MTPSTRNRPIGDIDLLGKDVYHTQGNSGAASWRVGQRLHQEVCVDLWDGPLSSNPGGDSETCCSDGEFYKRKKERFCISFALELDPRYNFVKDFAYYNGYVYKTEDNGTSVVGRFSTCCSQDIKIKNHLSSLIGQRGVYALLPQGDDFSNADKSGNFPPCQEMSCRSFSEGVYSLLEVEYSTKNCK